MDKPDLPPPSILDPQEFRDWLKIVREWSGSAFLAGERVPDEAQHKSDLYGMLCRLGNHLDGWADEAEALAAQASTRQAAEQALDLAREALERIADQMPATHEVTILTQVCGLASEALAALPQAEAGEKGEQPDTYGETWPCPICGGHDDDRQLMCEACGGVGMLGEAGPTDTGAGGDHGR